MSSDGVTLGIYKVSVNDSDRLFSVFTRFDCSELLLQTDIMLQVTAQGML